MNEDEILNVPISMEKLLAAILKTVGVVDIETKELLADYSNYQIAVEQVSEDVVSFQLIEAEYEDAE